MYATYLGGLDSIVVASLPSGRSLTMSRGEPVQILASEVDSLGSHPDIEVDVDLGATSDSPAQQDDQEVDD